ncbi:hypothetical protein BJQ90_02398 [Arthrobacter sp. SO3]|nr:hypothetical protein [Arthrobacter sp. SO3]
MQLERAEQLRLHDLGAQPASDAGGVVKNQVPRCGPDVFEHPAQPVADAFSGLAPVPLHEAHVREREGHHQDVQDLPDPGDDRLGLPEVDLRGASGPDQFGEALPGLPVPGRPFLHVPLDRGIRAGETMLGHETVKDALGRMALLARPALVLAQPLLNDALEPGQHRAPGPGQRCRRRRGEVLLLRVPGHRITTHPQPPGDLTPRDSLGIESSDIFLNGHGYRHLLSSPSGAHASQWQRRKEPIWGGGPMFPTLWERPGPPGDLYICALPESMIWRGIAWPDS